MPTLAQVATPRQSVIDIDGHKMSALLYNEDKETIPVVFIHGITSSVFFWDAGQLPYVKDNLKWISLSLPGHYPAVFPDGMTPEALTPELIAHLTSGSIKKLVGDQPVIIGGHSTGGFSAINMTVHHPKMVRALFSVSGFAQGKWTGALGFYQRLARMGAVGEWLFKQGFGVVGRSRSAFVYATRFYVADAAALYAATTFESNIDDSYPAAKQLDVDAMLVWFRQMPETDISARLGEISVPAFVLAGDSDPIVPPAQAQLIHEQVPNSELMMISGAGHLPFAERETEYNAALTAWLQRMVEV
jgi:pimeloyl-ACP methyl ester carboxylesterase